VNAAVVDEPEGVRGRPGRPPGRVPVYARTVATAEEPAQRDQACGHRAGDDLGRRRSGVSVTSSQVDARCSRAVEPSNRPEVAEVRAVVGNAVPLCLLPRAGHELRLLIVPLVVSR